MSSRFIKNRLVDFGMIKPTEFLKKKIFFHVYILCCFGRLNVIVCVQTIWIKIDSIRASMSECRKVNRLSEGAACPPGLCLRLALTCSTLIIHPVYI